MRYRQEAKSIHGDGEDTKPWMYIQYTVAIVAHTHSQSPHISWNRDIHDT